MLFKGSLKDVRRGCDLSGMDSAQISAACDWLTENGGAGLEIRAACHWLSKSEGEKAWKSGQLVIGCPRVEGQAYKSEQFAIGWLIQDVLGELSDFKEMGCW